MAINLDHQRDRLSSSSETLTINNTGALVLPSGTTQQRPGTAINGQLRFNSTDNRIEQYANSTWSSVGGIENITDLSDVTISNASTNDTIIFNGSVFENKENSVDNLSNTDITTYSNGQVLKYSSNKWRNAILELNDLSDVTITTTPAQDKILKTNSNGVFVIADAPIVFTGPTGSTNGTSGLVPAPQAGDQLKFLRADGAWTAVTQGSSGATYDISVAAGTTKLRLTGSDSTTDDIEFVGSGAATVSRTDENTLTINSTNTEYTAGIGITLTGTTFSTNDSQIDHDQLDNFFADEHIDWTTDQTSTSKVIHANNYTNTEYGNSTGITLSGTVFSTNDSEINHNALNNYVANQHIDWTQSNAGTIHSSNITFPSDINTTYTQSATTSNNKIYLTLEGNDGSTDSTEIAGSGATTITRTSDSIITISSTDTNTEYTAGTGITLTGTTFSANTSAIDHDSLNNFVANEHIDWTSSGAGTIDGSNVNHDTLNGFVAEEHVDWSINQSSNIHVGNLPAIALTTIQTATSQSDQLLKTAQEGDVIVRTDIKKTFMHNGGTAGNMNDYTELQTPTDSVTSVDGQTGAVTLDHDSLNGFVLAEHVDWTQSNQGTIHGSNINFPSDINTTYSVSIPAGTTKIRLSGNDNSTDDIEIVGTGNTSVSRTTDSKFTISSTDTTYTAGTGLTLTGTTFSANESAIQHNNLGGYQADEHIDWTADQTSTGKTIDTNNYTSLLTVKEINDPNSNNVSVSAVTEIQFDADGGFALTDLGNNKIKVGMESTFKTWKIYDTPSDTTPTDIIATGVDTISLKGGTGVTLAGVATAGSKSLTMSIGQDVTTTSDVTFNDVTVSGDLIVQGNTTTINTATLDVEDKNIILGKVTNPTNDTGDGGGITLKASSDKIISWSKTTDRWTFNTGTEINGLVHIKSEQGSSPTAPANGEGGYLYTKSDGLPYWVSNDLTETNLAQSTSTGSQVTIGTPSDNSWNDGAIMGKGETYNSHEPITGWDSNNDTVTNTIDNMNELVHNVYKNYYVKYATFTVNDTVGPAPHTVTFTVNSEVTDYNPNQYEWNFGDGNTSTVTTTSVSHTYSDTSGGTYDVTLTARNTNATNGTAGSFATFKRSGYITVYTPSPVPKFTYAYSQADSTSIGPTAHTSSPIYIDETSANSGTTNLVTFDVTTSENTTHWMIDFGDGSKYPSSANASESNASTIQSTWASYASVKSATNSFSVGTQDIERDVILYCYSSSTDPANPKSTSSTLKVRLMKHYSGLISIVNTPAGGNNDTASWNNTNYSINTEGLHVALTPTFSGSNTVNGTYGTQLSWGLANTSNSEEVSTLTYSASTATKNIVFTRADNTTAPDTESRVISLSLISQHTSSPFSVGSTTLSIKRDPRANFTGVFTTPSVGYTGADNLKGFDFIDYNGNDRSSVTFTDSSDDNGITGWSWDFNNNGSTDSTTQNPQYAYNGTGTYSVKLTLTHPNSYSSNDVDNTKTRTNYVTISSNPTAPATLASQSLTVTNTSSFTPFLCSGVTDRTGSTSLNAGDQVTRTTNTTVESNEHNYANEFPSNGDNTGSVRAVINGTAETGSSIKTFTIGDDAGTTGSLIITSDIDASATGSGTENTIPDGWYRVFKSKVKSASALSLGINSYAIRQLFSSSNTQRDTTTAEFVLDSSTTPTVQSGYSVGLNAIGTPRIFSQIRHFSTGGSIAISSLAVNNISTETYVNDPIEVDNNSNNALGSAVNLAYNTITGLSSPVAKNTNATGLSANVNMSGTGQGTGSIKIRSRNANGYGAYQTDSTNILYWYSTPTLDETSMTNSITAGTAITGKTNLIRVSGFDNSSATPSYTAADFFTNNAWSSSTSLGTYEAPLLNTSGGRFVWDNTNWQTYLPGLTNNPNNSSRSGGQKQYVTLAFCRKGLTSTGSFRIKYTGEISSLHIAIPGATTDSTSTLNGWLDCTDSVSFGYPGGNTSNGGNGDNGVRHATDPGTGAVNAAKTDGIFNISLNQANTGESGAITHNSNVLIRIGLSQDQYVSAISVEDYS